MKRVYIIQNYVPMYRLPFFEALTDRLRSQSVECRVLAGSPPSDQGARGDAVTSAPWLIQAHFRTLSVGGRTIHLGVPPRCWNDADGVILGLMGSSLNLYQAIFGRGRGDLRVGVWGHIKSYVNRGNPIDMALERMQMRRADHVFAYTPGGARHAIGAGVSPSKITTVMNSIDTTELERARASVSAEDAQSFAGRLLHGGTRTYAYCGGLDSSKRIDLLAETLEVLWRMDRGIRFLVAGSGTEANLLRRAQARGQVVLLGYADARTKALMARVSNGFVNPGRVGLLAVDALVLGRPILTTDFPYHAPEIEYLKEGESLMTSGASVEEYAELILSHSKREEPKGPRAWTYPTLGQMVSNFSTGVLRMLNEGSQGRGGGRPTGRPRAAGRSVAC